MGRLERHERRQAVLPVEAAFTDMLLNLVQQSTPIQRRWDKPSTSLIEKAQYYANVLIAHPLVPPAKPTPAGFKDYFTLDFRDFLEYATSDLAPAVNPAQWPDQRTAYYEALPRTFDEPLLSDAGGVSIAGAAVSRRGTSCGVYLCLRTFASTETEGWRQQGMEGQFGIFLPFPYYFVALLLDEEIEPQRGFFETQRSVIARGLKNRQRDYSTLPSAGKIVDIFYDWMDRIAASTDSEKVAASRLPELVAARKSFLDTHAPAFELARLMLLLPSYYDFMYDLVRAERVEVGESSRQSGKKRHAHNKPQAAVKYVLVRSIRVRYDEEERFRQAHKTPARTWTPPSYRYAVQGHWRVLHDQTHQGHDPDGNVVLGRTWVRGYMKGQEPADLRNVEFGVFDKDPQLVIKIKQPLAYARDVIAAEKSANQIQPAQAAQPPPPTAPALLVRPDERPSDEWMVAERQKLTAGLRYLILQRDGHRCVLCGARAADENYVRLEIDHIVPVSKWGRTVESNLRTLCQRCNKGKSDATE